MFEEGAGPLKAPVQGARAGEAASRLFFSARRGSEANRGREKRKGSLEQSKM
jgi:hypothetical protein